MLTLGRGEQAFFLDLQDMTQGAYWPSQTIMPPQASEAGDRVSTVQEAELQQRQLGMGPVHPTERRVAGTAGLGKGRL